jgi:hypothetical protein
MVTVGAGAAEGIVNDAELTALVGSGEHEADPTLGTHSGVAVTVIVYVPLDKEETSIVPVVFRILKSWRLCPNGGFPLPPHTVPNIVIVARFGTFC